jgi:hypothetical protein
MNLLSYRTSETPISASRLHRRAQVTYVFFIQYLRSALCHQWVHPMEDRLSPERCIILRRHTLSNVTSWDAGPRDRQRARENDNDEHK